MTNSRQVLESLIIGLSEGTNVIPVGAMVIERCPNLYVKSLSSEMVSGPKVKNVRHPREATFENMT